MANVFVNPGWISITGGTPVYITEDSVYKDASEGRTEATCYSTLAEAVSVSNNDDAIYVYNSTADSLSLSNQVGTYNPESEIYSYIGDRKNLLVRANKLQLKGNDSAITISDDITMDFRVFDAIVAGTGTHFTVTNGAVFILSKNESVENSVSFTNSGTITVSGSSFSAATVTNNGTFTVSGTSTLNIGNLSGTIATATNTTLQNSSITGGRITASGSVGVENSTISSNTFTLSETMIGAGAYFTGANTLNGVTLNASGRFVSVGEGDNDSLTITGTNTLIIGDLYGTIKLDGATIKDSSIVGVQSGGTLLVGSGKSATFSPGIPVRPS